MHNNTETPYISICIPAYQRVAYLQRLLESICSQDYADFEVLVSDDSRDDSVKDLVDQFGAVLPIRYVKNAVPLGTPANWNAAISQATGAWIKLMHDDDWFSRPNALSLFAQATSAGRKFIFSDYDNKYEENADFVQKTDLSAAWEKRIFDEPMSLLAYNVIGPPSVTMFHKSIRETYDERLKWRVDMEYYVRILQQERTFLFIPEKLVNVGISHSQVTQSCLYKPSIELPEGRILLEKHGVAVLQNVWVYDAWWRLLRNMKILRPAQLETYGNWPDAIYAMQRDLKAVPFNLTRFGPLSKAFMYLSYLKNKSLIRKSTA